MTVKRLTETFIKSQSNVSESSENLVSSHNLLILSEYMCDELDALPPKNGKRIGEDFTIGGKLQFKCQSKYTLVGPGMLTCLSSGQWSASVPKCERKWRNFT